MARGFGATFGTGTTDRVTSALTSKPVARSYAAWWYRNADGGGSLGNFFFQTGVIIRTNPTGSVLEKFRTHATGDSGWTVTRPSSGVWHHLGIAYDGSSVTQDPIIYLDGVSVSVTQTETASAGGANTTPAAIHVGNNDVSTRNWDGMLAEVGLWDVILTAGNFASLAGNAVPVIKPDALPTNLVEYIPMQSETTTLAGALTIVGTVVQAHPPIFGPPALVFHPLQA